jgi:hypothetical protein
MNVIDLDRPPTAAREPRGRKWGAALLVAGAVLGGTVTYGWTARREADVRDEQVSVLVFADAAQPDNAGGGSVVLDGRVTSVTLTRRVTLVNAGPEPVNIRNLAADRPGVTLRGVEKQRWVQPGATAHADADVEVDCARGLPLGRLRVTLSVQTLDERARQARAREVFDGSPWTEQAEIACAEEA